VNNEYIKLGIWAAVIGAIFIFLWRKGHLLRLRNYVQETNEELKKCTWPSWDELKGATFVVLISTLLLGFFTVIVDYVLRSVLLWVTKI